MEFKVMLIMDNAGGHPVDFYYEGVLSSSLPTPPLSSLYTPGTPSSTLWRHWTLTVNLCWRVIRVNSRFPRLTVIGRSLKDMKKETLNACWEKLWLECVHDCKGLSPEEVQRSAIDKAVQLARMLGATGNNWGMGSLYGTLRKVSKCPWCIHGAI